MLIVTLICPKEGQSVRTLKETGVCGTHMLMHTNMHIRTWGLINGKF